MKKVIISVWAIAAVCFQSFGQADTLQKVHIGFIYPISSNGSNAPKISNDFSLHLLSGISKNENVLSIAGISNHIKQDARGLQVAGLINQVGNSAHGVQVAGLGNFTKKETKGVQIAGLTNTSGDAEIQISGLINIADDVHGLQIAGLINKAGNVEGTQVAGLINRARDVKGVQIAGLINLAESSDYPIGIINIIKNGKQAVGLSYDETGTGMITYRSGGRVLYGLIGLGYNLSSKRSKDFYGFQAGIGAHIVKSEHFLLNAEAFSQSLTDFSDFSYSKHGIRLLPTLRIAKRVEIFAGPAFNVTQFNNEAYTSLYSSYFWTREKRNCFTGMSVGYTGGIQISL
ncbi:MAG: hypothetical protein ABS46_01330 [Cytophagaceae bacterium SCN 52-12]|nr:MAG: hypothetical protein ABS46_01330 [Cytophagaceae bacterium SCN 52-12]